MRSSNTPQSYVPDPLCRRHGWRCLLPSILGIALGFAICSSVWAQSNIVRFNPGPAITANYTADFEQLERGELAVDFLLTDLDNTVGVSIDGKVQSFLARSVVVFRKVYKVRGKPISIKVEAVDAKGKKSVRTFRFGPELLARATFKRLSDSIVGGSTIGNGWLVLTGIGLMAAGVQVGANAEQDFSGTVREPSPSVDRSSKLRATLLANGLIFSGALLTTIATWRFFGGDQESDLASTAHNTHPGKQAGKGFVNARTRPPAKDSGLRVGLTQQVSTQRPTLSIGFRW